MWRGNTNAMFTELEVGLHDDSQVSVAHLTGMTITQPHRPRTAPDHPRPPSAGPKSAKLGRSLRNPESCVRQWIEEKLHG